MCLRRDNAVQKLVKILSPGAAKVSEGPERDPENREQSLKEGGDICETAWKDHGQFQRKGE